MLDVARRCNANMYSELLTNENAALSLGNMSKVPLETPISGGPVVKASTLLSIDSSTEVIDLESLIEKPLLPYRQYIEIADSAGRLHCVDRDLNAACWLKIVTIAPDCQSSNVILTSTDEGIILKTIKSIIPGEPLLMWFSENILAALNMPYLTIVNILDQKRYICHLCNNLFEYPNPLKVHLALDCNRRESNHLWMQFDKKAYEKAPPPFTFELSGIPSPFITSALPTIQTTPLNTSVQMYSHINSSDHTTPAKFLCRKSLINAFDQDPATMNSSDHTSLINSSNQKLPSSSDHTSSHVNSLDVTPSMTPLNCQSLNNSSNHEQIYKHPVIVNHYSNYNNYNNSVQPIKEHLCLYCGKMYSRKYGLKIHIRTHTGYKPLQCKYCLRAFGDPSNLNKHVRLHSTTDTPYSCDICKKVLVRRRDLERHIRTRHGGDSLPTSMTHNTDNPSDEDMHS